jgi:ribosomal protein L40E
MVRLRYVSEQGYMAGRLLTAYISLKGYAPVTRNILYEWVRRMLAVSSREKAEHNIELLWRDRQIVNLQKNAVEEVIRELSKEGLENLAINPPKPFQKILETLIKCPGCGSQPIYGEKYCKQCGTRIPTKAWETTKETHKPITVEIEQKAGTPTIEFPYCGKELPPHAKYCTKCGASIVSPARERGGIREIFRRIQQDVSRKTTPEEPAPGLEREVSPESSEKTTPQAFKEHVKGEEKPSQAEEHVKPTAEKPVAEREPRTPTDVGEKPQPQQPSPPTRRITAAEPVPPKVDWEPAKWILDELEGLGVEPEEFKAVVEQVAHEGPDMGSYRAASVLAESMEFANDYEKASFITNVAALIPYAVNEYLAAVEQAKEREEKGGRESTIGREVDMYEQAETEQPGELKPLEDENKITLDELLKNGAEPGTLYILDPRYVRAPTLPTAVAAKLLEKLRPVPLEEAEVINLSEVYVLTQGMSTGKLKIRRVKADPGYPPLDKLVHAIKAGATCITVKGIYEILPVRAKNVMKVTLDRQVEEAYRRLLELMDEKDARRLEGFEALMPGVIQAVMEGRLEEYLKASYGLDGELRELLMDAVTVALDREKSKRSWIRNILMAFGVVE